MSSKKLTPAQSARSQTSQRQLEEEAQNNSGHAPASLCYLAREWHTCSSPTGPLVAWPSPSIHSLSPFPLQPPTQPLHSPPTATTNAINGVLLRNCRSTGGRPLGSSSDIVDLKVSRSRANTICCSGQLKFAFGGGRTSGRWAGRPGLDLTHTQAPAGPGARSRRKPPRAGLTHPPAWAGSRPRRSRPSGRSPAQSESKPFFAKPKE